MTVVDWVILGAVAVFALAGWMRGFVAGLLSFVGFIGGGVVAAWGVPRLLDIVAPTATWRPIGLIVGVLAGAVIGQIVASILGRRLRSHLTWRPARFVDHALGAALYVAALGIIVWLIASVLVLVPVGPVSDQVQRSRVVSAIDTLMPDPVRGAFARLQSVVASTTLTGAMAGVAHLSGPQVDAPDPAIVDGAVSVARPAVVRVSGSAPECDGIVSGSGFVIAPDRVMTNAHVVAGVARPVVQVRLGAVGVTARVVYFDPRADIAVLAADGLDAPALSLEPQQAASGADAVVAGFPNGGPFASSAARVRAQVTLHAQDIYGEGSATRSAYALRGSVQPGDSGGPLLTPDGRVLGMIFGADPQADTGYALTADMLDGPVAKAPSLTRRVDSGTCHIAE